MSAYSNVVMLSSEIGTVYSAVQGVLLAFPIESREVSVVPAAVIVPVDAEQMQMAAHCLR